MMDIFIKERKIKRGRRRCLALFLLIAVMLASLCGCSGSYRAALYIEQREPVTEGLISSDGKYEYAICSDNSVMLTLYRGDEVEVKIPELIDGMTVTVIGEACFAGKMAIKSVEIGNNVCEIGDFAFNMCSSLDRVKVGAQVYAVGYLAFSGTPWYEALEAECCTVGEGVLIKYNGPGGTIEIPDGVHHISAAFGGVADVERVVLGDGVYTIGSCAFAEHETLYEVVFGENLIRIGDNAFAGCLALKSVDIPDSVRRIGAYAFNGCTALTGVRIGRSLETIGDYAFFHCTRIKTVNLPSRLEKIGNYAFSECVSLGLVVYNGSEGEFNAVKKDAGKTNESLDGAYILYTND